MNAKLLRSLVYVSSVCIEAVALLISFGVVRFVFWLGEPYRVLAGAPQQKIVIATLSVLVLSLLNVATVATLLTIASLRRIGFVGITEKLSALATISWGLGACATLATWGYLRIANPSGNVLIPLSGVLAAILCVMCGGGAAMMYLFRRKHQEARAYQADSELTI